MIKALGPNLLIIFLYLALGNFLCSIKIFSCWIYGSELCCPISNFLSNSGSYCIPKLNSPTVFKEATWNLSLSKFFFIFFQERTQWIFLSLEVWWLDHCYPPLMNLRKMDWPAQQSPHAWIQQDECTHSENSRLALQLQLQFSEFDAIEVVESCMLNFWSGRCDLVNSLNRINHLEIDDVIENHLLWSKFHGLVFMPHCNNNSVVYFFIEKCIFDLVDAI